MAIPGTDASARLVATLSMATAEDRTPEPVYGMPMTSRRPCTQPSSPNRPCNAIHATRVLLDLELHAGDRGWESLVQMVAHATLMSEGWASGQVIRSLRIPLQSSTYLIGAQEILDLRKRSPLPVLELHERLLDLGPVPISRVRL